MKSKTPTNRALPVRFALECKTTPGGAWRPLLNIVGEDWRHDNEPSAEIAADTFANGSDTYYAVRVVRIDRVERAVFYGPRAKRR